MPPPQFLRPVASKLSLRSPIYSRFCANMHDGLKFLGVKSKINFLNVIILLYIPIIFFFFLNAKHFKLLGLVYTRITSRRWSNPLFVSNVTYFTEKLCEDRRKRFKFGPGRYVQPYLFESVHPAGDKYGDSDDEADVEHPHGHLGGGVRWREGLFYIKRLLY